MDRLSFLKFREYLTFLYPQCHMYQEYTIEGTVDSAVGGDDGALYCQKYSFTHSNPITSMTMCTKSKHADCFFKHQWRNGSETDSLAEQLHSSFTSPNVRHASGYYWHHSVFVFGQTKPALYYCYPCNYIKTKANWRTKSFSKNTYLKRISRSQ